MPASEAESALWSSRALRKLYTLGLCLLLVCFSSCQIAEAQELQALPETQETRQAPLKTYLDCCHYDETGFLKAIENSEPYRIDGEMLGAVSPHFLPVMSFTANIMSTLAQEGPPDLTIFILAPDHNGVGLPLKVADRGWSTPFGNLESDEEATAAILNHPLLADKIDVDLFHLREDHSAATLMPFIKHYMPEARVVTVLIGRDCRLEQLQALSKTIYEAGETKAIFVLASVDFSHYLNIIETAQRDELTDELIRAGDVQAIKQLDSGNLDSPESLIVLMNYSAYFPDVRVDRQENIILPESETRKEIGYSYNVYIFSA